MLRDAYIGEDKVSRIYTGEHIIHPSPVKDGLVLWYDFMGRKNSDVKRGIAEDLSGNGNHGTLTNFAYQPGSGYENGLRFDGVDDYIAGPTILQADATYSIEVNFKLISRPALHSGVFMVGGGVGRMWIRILGTYSLGINAYFGSGADYSLGAKVLNPGDNVWMTAVFDREAHKMQMYLDGALAYSLDTGDHTGVGWSQSSLRTDLPTSYAPTNAVYRSLKVYNRALTPTEIAHNYQLEKERWNL